MYQNFHSGEPNSESEKCVTTRTPDPQWVDVNCASVTNVKQFYCNKYPDAPTGNIRQKDPKLTKMKKQNSLTCSVLHLL